MNKIYADVSEDYSVDGPNFQWVVLASEVQVELSSLNESLGIWKVKACEAAEREASLREELSMERNITTGQRKSLDVCAEQINTLQKRLTVAEQFVQRMADCSKNQDSIATGYLSDILDVIKGKNV